MRERTRELGLLIIGDVVGFLIALYLTLMVRYWAIPSEELLNAHVPPVPHLYDALGTCLLYLRPLRQTHTNDACAHHESHHVCTVREHPHRHRTLFHTPLRHQPEDKPAHLPLRLNRHHFALAR